MKLIQKLPRHESISGQICSECNCAISNHNVEVDTKKPNSMIKLHSCRICKSKDCAW